MVESVICVAANAVLRERAVAAAAATLTGTGFDSSLADSLWGDDSPSPAGEDEGDAHANTCSVLSVPETRLPSPTFRIFAGGHNTSPVRGPSEGLGTPQADSKPG